MADVMGTVKGKTLVAQTSAVLLTRGLEVEPVSVRNVIGHMVDTVAERVGMDAEEAIHLVTSEAVADAIVAAADQSIEGSASVHSVRPVRVDARKIHAETQILGRLVMTASQAGKYASLNDDGRSAAHAMDLATEIGAAIAADGPSAEEAEIPVGLLDELVGLVELVAGRVETDGWSICPCGEQHEPFVDKSPAQIWATLLDEGTYLCSVSTMYRLLREHGEVRERRAQATHPPRAKPELVATGPSQVWTWDATKLKGPDRGVYYDLFVMLDIYSRKAVHWLVVPRESAALATEFIQDAFRANGGVVPDVVHADRGASMTSKPVAQLLTDLNIVRSHSRPRVSNDNPYSEANFKTLKYCPVFPDRFGSLADAARSASSSSPTTTPSTGTPASACTPPPPYTTAPR